MPFGFTAEVAACQADMMEMVNRMIFRLSHPCEQKRRRALHPSTVISTDDLARSSSHVETRAYQPEPTKRRS
jgi:hypothetical protein